MYGPELTHPAAVPTALVIGCNGQDGSLLCDLLHHKGYEVAGVARHGSGAAFVRCYTFDVCDSLRLRDAIAETHPDEIYYLAAYHHSSEQPRPAKEIVEMSFRVNTLALNHVLAAAADRAEPRPRVFYAATSRIFGEPDQAIQDESTPMAPVCAYGISKAAGVSLCRYYRSERGVHASAGILYNHESPLRPPHFVTRKIARAAVRIRQGLERELVLGDLNAQVDWGWAPDYVEAMHALLQAASPGDFVVATGALHSVRDLVEIAFDAVGLDWREFVVEKGGVLKTAQPAKLLCGNPARIAAVTGWRPRMKFEDMVRAMVAAEEGKPWLACGA